MHTLLIVRARSIHTQYAYSSTRVEYHAYYGYSSSTLVFIIYILYA